jgi:hypothetical protein
MKRLTIVYALLLLSLGLLSLGLPSGAQALTQLGKVLQNNYAGTGNANGDTIAVSGYLTATLQVSGTFSGTVIPEGSVNGSTYNTLTCYQLDGITAVTSFTGIGTWRCNITGHNILRARVSSYTSGSISVHVTVTDVGQLGTGSSGAVGFATAATPTYLEGSANLFSLDLNGNIRFTQGTLQSCENQAGGVQANSWCATRPQPFITYTATNSWTPPATPTDLLTITGSASKTIKIWSCKICTTNTAAGSQEFFLIKRSTADTGGTVVAGTVFPLDSAAAAATATVAHYTANPGTLGTAIGTINRVRIASPAAVPASFAGVVIDACYELLPAMRNGIYVQPIVLRGIAEQLAVNFNGAALVAGQTHSYTIVWSEE